MNYTQPLLVAFWLGLTSCGGGQSVECKSNADCGGILVCRESQCLMPSSLGLGGAASFDTGSGFVGMSCRDCITISCSEEVGSCEGSSDCLGYSNCVDDCSSSTCSANCATTYTNGASLFNGVLNCASTSCQTSCNAASNGSDSSATLPTGYGGVAPSGNGGAVYSFGTGGASYSFGTGGASLLAPAGVGGARTGSGGSGIGTVVSYGGYMSTGGRPATTAAPAPAPTSSSSSSGEI